MTPPPEVPLPPVRNTLHKPRNRLDGERCKRLLHSPAAPAVKVRRAEEVQRRVLEGGQEGVGNWCEDEVPHEDPEEGQEAAALAVDALPRALGRLPVVLEGQLCLCVCVWVRCVRLCACVRVCARVRKCARSAHKQRQQC